MHMLYLHFLMKREIFLESASVIQVLKWTIKSNHFNTHIFYIIWNGNIKLVLQQLTNDTAQFKAIHALDNLPERLSLRQREMLRDPKTFGERLEMFIETCIAKQDIVPFVLCLNNEVINRILWMYVTVLLEKYHQGATYRHIVKGLAATGST